MTFADLRLPCQHGEYGKHPMEFANYNDPAVPTAHCPGGRSATIEDLAEALREAHWLVYPPGPPPRPKDLASDREEQ